MSNAKYLGVSIDNPPPLHEVECESSIGQAVNHLRHGRRIPFSLAAELMADGIDIPGLAASEARYPE